MVDGGTCWGSLNVDAQEGAAWRSRRELKGEIATYGKG
jgi:hypothetical protein